MRPSVKALRSRRAVLTAALAAFACIFVLRLIFPAPTSGISFLYYVPISVLAIEFGRRGGFLAAIGALALTQIGTLLSAYPLPVASYLPRAAGYLAVGLLTGWMAERMRAVDVRMREAARHLELSGDILFTIDFEGRLVHASGPLVEMLGWTMQELARKSLLSLVHPDDRELTVRANTEAVSGEPDRTYVNRCQTKAGPFLWLEWSSHADHEMRRIYLLGSDVTKRRTAERASRDARERFRRVFEDSFAGIAVVSLEGQIIEANQTLASLLGYRADELTGRGTQAEFAASTAVPIVREGIGRLMSGEVDSYRGELQLKQRGGGFTWVDMTMSLIRDADGTPLYRVTQVLDIQARKEAEEQLRHLADHDSLSGVYNRRRFEEELQLELGHSGQSARSAAVLLFDVDGFKQVNDTLGHTAGDRVISDLGAALRDHVRTGDVVARLGGDEFAILLRRIQSDEALRVAAKIRKQASLAIANSVGRRVETGLSVGVAMIDGAEPAAIDQLLSRADEAMYEAKREGGNKVVRSSVDRAAAGEAIR